MYELHDYRPRWFGWMPCEPDGAGMMGFHRGPLRHAPHWIHDPVSRYHRRQPYTLFGRVRLGGWLAFAGPLFLIEPRLAIAGPVMFEAVVWAAGRRAMKRMRATPPWLPPSSGNPDAGVREPRRPYPNAGAGAIALPEPFDG